ncbi:MAG: thiamine pyrophosphate-dependent enzyme [Nitrososphaerales archaeon]
MKRFDCLKILKSLIDPRTITITSFRGNGIEWSYLRGDKLNLYGFNMGLCTPVAVGVAAAVSDHNVIALDSDGSFLLDTGILVTLAGLKLKNLCIIVFDNEAYGEYGRSPTFTGVSLEKLSDSVGIYATTVTDLKGFTSAIKESLKFGKTTFINAKVESGVAKINSQYAFKSGRRIREEFEESMREELGSKYRVGRKNTKSGEKLGESMLRPKP